MTELQRAACVQRLADADADALQCLLVEYHPMLRRTIDQALEPAIRRLIDPDDVLQQAYIAAFRRFAEDRFDGPPNFYAWLRQIAVNELRGFQRRQHRRKRDIGRQLSAAHAARRAPGGGDFSTSYPDLLARLSAADPTPSASLRRSEAVAAMMTCLARLGDEQRAVVQLRFLEDVSVPEIARRLGKSDDAIYMLCHRGLKRLSEILGSLTQHLTRL